MIWLKNEKVEEKFSTKALQIKSNSICYHSYSHPQLFIFTYTRIHNQEFPSPHNKNHPERRSPTPTLSSFKLNWKEKSRNDYLVPPVNPCIVHTYWKEILATRNIINFHFDSVIQWLFSISLATWGPSIWIKLKCTHSPRFTWVHSTSSNDMNKLNAYLLPYISSPCPKQNTQRTPFPDLAVLYAHTHSLTVPAEWFSLRNLNCKNGYEEKSEWKAQKLPFSFNFIYFLLIKILQLNLLLQMDFIFIYSSTTHTHTCTHENTHPHMIHNSIYSVWKLYLYERHRSQGGEGWT